MRRIIIKIKNWIAGYSQKCEMTLSRKHLWIYPPYGDLIHRKKSYIDEEGIIRKIPKRCIACGLIDDFFKQKKGNKIMSKTDNGEKQ